MVIPTRQSTPQNYQSFLFAIAVGIPIARPPAQIRACPIKAYGS